MLVNLVRHSPRRPPRPARSRVLVGLGLLLLLCGCGTTNPARQRVHTLPVRPAAASPRSALPAPPSQVPPPATAPTPNPTLPAPAAPATSSLPDWLALNEWWRSRVGQEPEPAAGTTVAAFDLKVGPDALRVAAASRLAQWNGTQLWLGFAPTPTNGSVLLHRSDLERTIAPLFGPAAPAGSRPRTVVIDPGHGGPSGGTRSALGLGQEKDYTLDWALRVAPLLRDRGWRVVLTRTNDVEVGLPERVAIADAAEAELFVSLHFNSAHPRTELHGLETYCLTPTGQPSTITRDYDDDPRSVFPNNQYDEANVRTAMRLHRALLQRTAATDRGVRRARFMAVLRAQNRPAVLLEAGYLSNPDEALRIDSKDYRQTLAEALAAGLDEAAPTLAGANVPPPPTSP